MARRGLAQTTWVPVSLSLHPCIAPDQAILCAKWLLSSLSMGTHSEAAPPAAACVIHCMTEPSRSVSPSRIIAPPRITARCGARGADPSSCAPSCGIVRKRRSRADAAKRSRRNYGCSSQKMLTCPLGPAPDPSSRSSSKSVSRTSTSAPPLRGDSTRRSPASRPAWASCSHPSRRVARPTWRPKARSPAS